MLWGLWSRVPGTHHHQYVRFRVLWGYRGYRDTEIRGVDGGIPKLAVMAGLNQTP